MSADESGGTASIPATNGDLHATTPDPPSLATPAKRKRVSSHDDKVTQDAGSSASQVQEKTKLQETLRNLVEILSKNDTDLQLLSCPLPSSPAKPRSKRAKVSGEKDEASTIQSRVASNRYNTLSEFLGDIEKASAAVIERNKALASGLQADGSPVTETVNRIAAFKKLLNSLVRQAHTSQSNVKAETSEEDAETPAKFNTSNVETRNENLVLTLFGNPANPKQLYSSLQKSVKVPLPSDDPKAEKYIEVQAPLREVGLPNGITTTKIEPYNLDEKPAEPKRTFGEVFAPRSTLPQLETPRKAKSSRSALNGWVDPFEAITDFKAFRGDRNNYCLALLPSGQWLQYGGVTSSPSYWNRRDKHQLPQQHSDEKYTDDPSLGVDEDSAVLQGVYSSFAPSFDSSGAVVQADSKNLVWWSKRGTKRLETLLSIPYQEVEEETTSERPGNIGELDESTLEEMVKNFKPEDFADSVTCSDASKADKEEGAESQDVDELLHDVSDLLETLSSYQRIRNLDVSAPNAQGAEPKETGSDSKSADTPSTEELGVYETLKSSLAALISNLPPYAVAKLNGDQLDELNISQKIVIENPDYRGTMEKDDFTAHQERSAAMAPMSGAANRTSTPSRYNSRPYSSGSRVQSQGGFPQQPYYGARQPSTSGPYTPGHPQQYAGPRPPTTPSQRPGYLPGYSQPTPQFNQQFQRPGQNGYASYSAQQGPAAQASPQPYTPRPAQPGAYNASFATGRSASPQKQASYAAPRTPYMTPGSNNPQQRFIPQQPQQPQPQQQQQQQQQQQPQQPPPYGNYSSNQSPAQSAAYSNSAAAMTYARSAAEQAALMERNRTQLAAHARQSSTPQPTTEGSSQDRSVTPGNKQNGNAVPS
ncbi:hypothetical protein APSETT444_003861 [Aspergillus pseudonomiae]